MTKTRRDFIKATATVSLIGISEASAKPRNKYKKGGERTKTVTVHKVCVVSSIPFAGTKFETQFKAGLGGNITYKTPKDGKGYDLTTLQQAISDAGSDGDTLVVTAGGLVVAQAAKGLTGSIPYISLVGEPIISKPDQTVNLKVATTSNRMTTIWHELQR
jgi:hypothetical protein